MRKRVLNRLKGPDSGSNNFQVYAVSLKRDNETLTGVGHDDILDNDDVFSGIVKEVASNRYYPIVQGVLSMLPDQQVRRSEHQEYYRTMLENADGPVAEEIQQALDWIGHLEQQDNDASTWNWQEMDYYDEDVSTQEKRNSMLAEIRSTYLPHIFVEREKYLFADARIPQDAPVLEVGCGNARTVARLLGDRLTNYVGVDISINRLQLAKMVMPEGDFIQADGMNLPIVDGSVSYLVFLGSLHHMPDPTDALTRCGSVLKPGGRILIHEPIDKPATILGDGTLARWFESYEHSEHDNELDWVATAPHLEAGYSDLKVNFAVTVIRTLGARVITSVGFSRNSLALWKALIFVDDLFKSVFCRSPNRLGPNAVFVSAQKKTATMH